MDLTKHTREVPPPPEMTLTRLMLDLFENNRALLLVLRKHTQTLLLAERVPDPLVPREEFAFEVASQVVRHGMTDLLLEALSSERPRRFSRIRAAARELSTAEPPSPIPKVQINLHRHSWSALQLALIGMGTIAAAIAATWGALESRDIGGEQRPVEVVEHSEPSPAPRGEVTRKDSPDPMAFPSSRTVPFTVDSNPRNGDLADRSPYSEPPRTKPKVPYQKAEDPPAHSRRAPLSDEETIQLRLASQKTGEVRVIGVPRFQQAEKAAEEVFINTLMDGKGQKYLEDEAYELCRKGEGTTKDKCFRTQPVGDVFDPGDDVFIKRTTTGDGYQNGSPKGGILGESQTAKGK